MSFEGQGHLFTIYFPGFVCFVLFLANISGERLQDHWSSGLNYLSEFSERSMALPNQFIPLLNFITVSKKLKCRQEYHFYSFVCHLLYHIFPYVPFLYILNELYSSSKLFYTALDFWTV